MSEVEFTPVANDTDVAAEALEPVETANAPALDDPIDKLVHSALETMNWSDTDLRVLTAIAKFFTDNPDAPAEAGFIDLNRRHGLALPNRDSEAYPWIKLKMEVWRHAVLHVKAVIDAQEEATRRAAKAQALAEAAPPPDRDALAFRADRGRLEPSALGRALEREAGRQD